MGLQNENFKVEWVTNWYGGATKDLRITFSTGLPVDEKKIRRCFVYFKRIGLTDGEIFSFFQDCVCPKWMFPLYLKD